MDGQDELPTEKVVPFPSKWKLSLNNSFRSRSLIFGNLKLGDMNPPLGDGHRGHQAGSAMISL